MKIHDDPDERFLYLRHYAKALNGRVDLMVYTTADEVRRFILSGYPPERATT